MKQKVIVLCFCLAALGTINAQRAEVFVQNNKYGIADGTKILAKPIYKQIKPVADNAYFVVKNTSDYAGVIDSKGKLIIPDVYEYIEYFDEDNFKVRKNDKWGIVNKYNYEAIPTKYTRIDPIIDNIAKIWDGTKVGYLSKYGVLIIPPIYQSIEKFTPTIYLVSQNGKFGLLNDLGETIVAPTYDEILQTSNPRYYDIKKNGQVGKMNTAFEVVLNPEYDAIDDSEMGMALTKNGKIGFYTTNGRLIAPKYSKIVFIQPEFGIAVIKEGNLLGFVTSKGLEVSPRYDNISRFSSKGVAFVEKNGKLMAVDVNGREETVQQVMNSYQRPPM